MMTALDGVLMELQDCALPLLRGDKLPCGLILRCAVFAEISCLIRVGHWANMRYMSASFVATL